MGKCAASLYIKLRTLNACLITNVGRMRNWAEELKIDSGCVCADELGSLPTRCSHEPSCSASPKMPRAHPAQRTCRLLRIRHCWLFAIADWTGGGEEEQLANGRHWPTEAIYSKFANANEKRLTADKKTTAQSCLKHLTKREVESETRDLQIGHRDLA